MQCLEVSGAVRPIYVSLGVKRIKRKKCLPASAPFCCPEQMISLLVNMSGNDSFVNLKIDKKIFSFASYFLWAR